jgi:hypothetical protein
MDFLGLFQKLRYNELIIIASIINASQGETCVWVFDKSSC